MLMRVRKSSLGWRALGWAAKGIRQRAAGCTGGCKNASAAHFTGRTVWI